MGHSKRLLLLAVAILSLAAVHVSAVRLWGLQQPGSSTAARTQQQPADDGAGLRWLLAEDDQRWRMQPEADQELLEVCLCCVM
jgi:hypothetical protein